MWIGDVQSLLLNKSGLTLVATSLQRETQVAFLALSRQESLLDRETGSWCVSRVLASD